MGGDINLVIGSEEPINLSFINDSDLNLQIVGISSLQGLTDTPSEPEALRFLRWNAAGDAIEYVESSVAVAWGAITGTLSNQADLQAALTNLLNVESITFKTDSAKDYSAGQLSYDPVTKTGLYDTGFQDVRVNIGQENHIRFFNNTGSEIKNGKIINASGVNSANDIFNGILADSSSPITSSAVIGAATLDVPDQTVGVATILGDVRDIDTFGLSEGGIIYLDTAGNMTKTRPLSPNNIVILGSVVKTSTTAISNDGIAFLKPNVFNRINGSRSYSFTSNGIGAGVYYLGGWYDSPISDSTITQAINQTLGTANIAYAAHGFSVFGGPGSVDSGQVGLRINGTSITDDGVLTTSDSEVLTDDITSLSLNQYLESPKKWVGQITYELYVVSGSPTTYSLTMNYGFCKHEDLGNKDFTVTKIEAVGLAGVNDTNFNIELLHHKHTGWIYSAAAFDPGNGVIASFSDDMAPFDDLANAQNFSWKRDDLSQFIDGNGEEGVIIKITTGANNSVQSMDVHLVAVLEEFTL